jgi:DNA-directed RNA polymerase subunit RPC12/RpoP
MKKLTYEFVKESFEKEGYELLSTEYVDSQIKLKYKCFRGHEHSITWAMWQQGNRCPRCAVEQIANKNRLVINFIRSEFAKEDYILLTTEYKNNRQKLKYICSKGHKHNIVWSSWQQGCRCPYCVGRGKPAINFVRRQFAKEDYKLLTKKYINCDQKLEYICSKGHKHSISWNSWQHGSRCPYCANRQPITIEFVREQFEKEGYKLLTDKYINCDQKLYYICPKGHKHFISWGNWQQGKRCPYCIGKISKGEVEVRDFIKSLGIKVSANDRGQIFNPETGNGFELDIFMPTLNKAIEYNGEYWHKNKINNDLFKQELCELKDIDLLIVWDKEWKVQSNICKNRIMRFVFSGRDI